MTNHLALTLLGLQRRSRSGSGSGPGSRQPLWRVVNREEQYWTVVVWASQCVSSVRVLLALRGCGMLTVPGGRVGRRGAAGVFVWVEDV